MKSWLEKNAIEMHSIYNKEKSVVSEESIRTLKDKIYKRMTATSKNVYIDEFDDKVTEYNNTYQRTVKMKPIDVKLSMYFDFNKENNEDEHKFKVRNHLKI